MLVKTHLADLQLTKIIQELGTFDESEGALKMYSRRGQCFTTTKYIGQLDPSEIQMVEDIKVRKTDDPEDREGEYCFTDGCGNVSTELCKAMNEVVGVYRCSAFQVRLGGAKGVLMHKPELPGRMVELRPSQVKFVANEYVLEVVRGATFTQGYLNRQIILLLSCLGVPDEVFIHHLTNAMESLDMRVVLSNLEKIYKKSKKHKGDRKNLAQEMELFFGPSKVFGPIFKHALVRSFDLKHE